MSEADPVLRLLGLAARAGGVVPGTERVRSAAGSRELRFAILAADASENSRAKLLPALVANDVEHVVAYDRARLGAAVGRAPLSAVGVMNPSLAARIKVLIGPASGAERK